MYAIGNVIFGISPDYELSELMDQNEMVDMAGITTRYSGSGMTPMFIGADITEIDECNDVDLIELFEEVQNDDKMVERAEKFEADRKIFLEEIEVCRGMNDMDVKVLNRVKNWAESTAPSFKIVWSTS